VSWDSAGSDGSFESWRQRRARKRLRPGTGQPLQPYRWWQLLSRSLFYLRMTRDDGTEALYAVSVNHMGDSETGEVMADLYLNGKHSAESKVPAAFPVPGGTIAVAASNFGLKRCHFIGKDGTEFQLTPDPRSGEGRRAKFDSEHPTASRYTGVVSLVVLIVGLAILIPQLLASISVIPPIADTIGSFTSPFEFSVWQNTAITLITGAASTERALRLRYNWLLDGSAG
jgi:hypothetical protein